MNIRFKYILSEKSVYIAALSACLIAIAAFAFLSFLITLDSRKSNVEVARKIFFRKYETIEKEFKNIEDYQYLLRALVEKNGLKNYKDYSTVVNDLNKRRELVPYSWYYYYDDSSGKSENRIPLSNIFKTKEKVQKSKKIKNNAGDKFTNYLITRKDSIYWLSYDSLALPNKSTLYYGSAVSLDNFHQYFSDINSSPNTYTYIFTKEGTCINYPEKQNLGKNIFDFTSVIPSDTIASGTKLGYTEKNTISEYLGVEVIRFIKPIKTDSFEGYVAINYVNFLIDENVNRTKTYAVYIFLVALFLIVTVFILYLRSRNLAYKEREKIQSEKNLLLIENEKMQSAEALSQLQQLKNNINPHFLFNSLNSLYMLIGLNRENAQKFTMNLSKIYRYLIVPPKANIVSVSQEINFIEKYMELLKSRFDEELSFKIKINQPKSLEKRMPYLSLQIVTENVIKHNIATIDHPLEMIITVEENLIIVKNTWQPKKGLVQGEKFGLDYLGQIYQYFKNDGFKTFVQDGYFVCYLPLMD